MAGDETSVPEKEIIDFHLHVADLRLFWFSRTHLLKCLSVGTRNIFLESVSLIMVARGAELHQWDGGSTSGWNVTAVMQSESDNFRRRKIQAHRLELAITNFTITNMATSQESHQENFSEYANCI